MDIKHVITELASHPEGSFLEMLQFNGAGIGACSITGTSPVWEMHPDTDELFYIIDGEFEMVLLAGDQPERCIASAGSLFVVPQGVWHKPGAPQGSKFIYLTPGTTLHSDADDPRKANL